MTTRYVGPGGSDANSGLTWALRKLTLNGVEDTPVVAGDTVYVGPGTYRELLTVDVSGTAGNPITYIGDYSGVNTDGVGGVVRITGSDNDQTAIRGNCISAVAKNYRSFTGFLFDTTSGVMITSTSGGTNWTFDQCCFTPGANDNINLFGAGGGHTIQNCIFRTHASFRSMWIWHSSVFDNASDLIQNCVFLTYGSAVSDSRVGGVTVKNSSFLGRGAGVLIPAALTVGQTITVNNFLF